MYTNIQHGQTNHYILILTTVGHGLSFVQRHTPDDKVSPDIPLTVLKLAKLLTSWIYYVSLVLVP